MIISIPGILLLLTLIVLLYVWPASARPGRPLAAAMTVAVITLVLFWLSAYVGPIAMEDPRGLSAAIDLAFRGVATGYVIMAGAAQGVRRWAQSNNVTAYRHWVVVLLGGLIAPVLIVPFF